MENSNYNSYEKSTKKDYSEFGKEGLDLRHWGTAIDISGRRFNAYTDKKYIQQEFSEPIKRYFEQINIEQKEALLVDLGGADGFLLNTILQNIDEKNPDVKKTGVVVDLDPTEKERVRFKKAQESGERKNINFAVANVTELPFEDNSVDVIISRMTVQYLNQNKQREFFQEISRVLKIGGLAIIMTVDDFSEGEKLNKTLEEITSIISGNSNFDRSLLTYNTIKLLGKDFEGSAFKPILGHRNISMPFSIEGFADRFNLDEDKKQKLDIVFKNGLKLNPELFEIIDGILCLKAKIHNMQLKKISDSNKIE